MLTVIPIIPKAPGRRSVRGIPEIRSSGRRNPEIVVILILGPPGTADEFDVTAVLQDAVEDGLGEVLVVQRLFPFPQGFVGGEDHWSFGMAAAVDDTVEDIGRIVSVLEISDLVDDQGIRLEIGRGCLAQPPVLGRRREVVDQVGGRDEAGVVAMLDRLVRDGDGQVRLPKTGTALQDQMPAVRHKIRVEEGAELAAFERMRPTPTS